MRCRAASSAEGPQAIHAKAAKNRKEKHELWHSHVISLCLPAPISQARCAIFCRRQPINPMTVPVGDDGNRANSAVLLFLCAGEA